MADRRYLSAGATAGSLCFLLLAWWVVSGGSKGFDNAIREAVNAKSSVPLTHVMQAITTLGSGWVLWPLGSAFVWRLGATGRRNQAIWFAAVCLGANLISQLLKLVFHRVRPTVFFGLPPAGTYSFPSGHAFMAWLFYGMMIFILAEDSPSPVTRRVLAALAIAMGLLIGFSRVYLGYHYPSDVLGGWTMAITCFLLANLLRRRSVK